MIKFTNPLEEHLYIKYLEQRNNLILKPARIKFVFASFILIIYALLDYYVYHLPCVMLTRIPSLLFILLFYIFDKAYFNKGKTEHVLLLNNTIFVSLLLMIYTVYILYYAKDQSVSTDGIILVSAITGIEIKGRLSTIMAIFIIPFVLFASAMMFIVGQLPSDTLVAFTHVLTITVLMIVISHFLENQNFKAFKANKRLEIERNKTQTLYANIVEQKEEIESQKEEITLQRDLAQNQKNQLQTQRKEIIDSLEYAKRIQQALLPAENIYSNNFKDYFIIYHPRDIVSGDFYWASKNNEWVTFAVADCTGHGVPAGFMSMLGFSFLKEIYAKINKSNVDSLLNALRTEIIEVLDQKDTFGSAKDGMDIGVCAYNTKTSKLYFTGANFSLYIIRDARNDPKVEEIKGDKMPISIHYKMKPFTLHETSVAEDDTIYLYSDGFHDQFGGPLGKKIKSKIFKNLLLSVSGNDMSFQKRLLNDYLQNWMEYSSEGETKTYEQNDDITVLGIRF